jgi:hypothetical protein
VETLRKVRDIGLSSALALRKLRNRKPLFRVLARDFGVWRSVYPWFPYCREGPRFMQYLPVSGFSVMHGRSLK